MENNKIINQRIKKYLPLKKNLKDKKIMINY